MRLTDSLDEQALLEEMLERSKPDFPADCEGLHYLLATPFRYAPYSLGSRFRRAGQPEGAFYAADSVATAVAEICFYRLLFFAEAPGTTMPNRPVEHTVFAVRCAADRCIDLREPPFDRDRDIWRHPTAYAGCQDIADAARSVDIRIIRYRSVRDPNAGGNCAVLVASAFAERAPKNHQTWHIFPGAHAVRAWCENPHAAVEFRPDDFRNDPRIVAAMPGASAQLGQIFE
ncbi:MAG TPA: RES family NAD+ phosphorylase [Stellaceae bacterium]|nr:RES family NAD+ phosphorylase [Stellaceae bacterium]